jgi:hypothetical protein
MPFEYEEPGEDYEFFEEDGESFVTSYVGSDTDTGFAYYVVTSLAPYSDHVEYSFYIAEIRPDGTERQLIVVPRQKVFSIKGIVGPF